MKVLHVIGGGLDGGAAQGAQLLHKALLHNDIQSGIVTNARNPHGLKHVETTRDGLLGDIKTKILSLAERTPKIFYPHRSQQTFSTGLYGFDLRKFDSFKLADVVHLHWINAGFISIKYLSRIEKPIVWTLRDMWPMTGGCHHALQCKRYYSQCGACPQLKSHHANDVTRMVFKNKKKHLPPTIEIVATSKWIKQCALKSALLRANRISTIHNGIDTNQFYPVPKPEARRLLGIPENVTVLLFGAQYIDEPYKGLEYFLKAREKLKCSNVFVLFFGRFSHHNPEQFNFPHQSVGFVDSVDQMRNLYSAADVYVAPSIAEAFGKTTAEAQACGIPVVCFDDFGQKDIVAHMCSGYRAKTFDAEDLCVGIDWVIADKTRYKVLSEESRKRAVEKFDISVTTQKYIKVYDSLLRPS